MLASPAARAAAATAVTAMAALTVFASSASAASGVSATSAAPASAAGSDGLPSDAYEQLQSDLIAADGVATGRGVTIALLSTGVDTTVAGLASQVINGPDYISQPKVPLTDASGTLMAEFLLGVPGYGEGLVPGAWILSLRTEPDSSEPGYNSFYNMATSDVERPLPEAIRYAVSHGAAVIDIDDAWPAPDADLLEAVSYALSRNVVVIAPEDSTTGTPDDESDWSYPAGIPGVIGVSAVTLPGGQAPYSSTPMAANNSVLISGPANTVDVSADGYQLDGTAIAVPFVAATAAMIKEKWPQMSPALVARALAMSARYHPSGGYSPAAGFGVVDPYEAIIDAGKLARLTATAPAGAPGTVAAGARFSDGSPPGVISVLPSAWPWYAAYGALAVVAAAALACGGILAARRRPGQPPAGDVSHAGPQFAPQVPPSPPENHRDYPNSWFDPQ
jgi:Subtilase family